MILEIPYGDLPYDLVVKCAKFCYERYFERQIMENWPVMIYDHCHDVYYSVRYLINECRDPKPCFTCLINGCLGVKMSPFLRAWAQ